VVLAFYDTLLALVLALYMFDFVATIDSNMALCDAPKTRNIPTWSLLLAQQNEEAAGHSEPDDFLTLSAHERCLRLIGTVLIAGGFASGVGAILGVLHFGSVLCRAFEACYVWFVSRKRKATTRESIELQESGTDWHTPPRDVDIHTRAAREGGHLTGISEEEQSTGGGLRRRRRVNSSNSSGSAQSTTSSAMGKLENVLLECLVP
jgi:hypothetical protein